VRQWQITGQTADDKPLDWYPVSREVNNVRNESHDLVRPAPVEKELFQPLINAAGVAASRRLAHP
jgi:hypothetical protein